MTIVELVQMFAEPLDLAVVLTDVDLDRPGPTILYTNPAFTRMTGFTTHEVLGASPRLLQGPSTSREATRMVARSLRFEGRYRGVLQNCRKSGAAYLCEIDARAILDRTGRPEAYIAFEREVLRRRGRPSRNAADRYRPLTPVDPTYPAVFSAAPDLFT